MPLLGLPARQMPHQGGGNRHQQCRWAVLRQLADRDHQTPSAGCSVSNDILYRETGALTFPHIAWLLSYFGCAHEDSKTLLADRRRVCIFPDPCDFQSQTLLVNAIFGLVALFPDAANLTSMPEYGAPRSGPVLVVIDRTRRSLS